MGWQRWLLAIGIASTAVSLSTRITFHGAHVTRVRPLLFDHPYLLGAALLIGIACLAVYRELGRRHRTGA